MNHAATQGAPIAGASLRNAQDNVEAARGEIAEAVLLLTSADTGEEGLGDPKQDRLDAVNALVHAAHRLRVALQDLREVAS